MKDNLRWEIYLPKDSVTVKKTENILSINILKPTDFEDLSEKIGKLSIQNQYISSIKNIKSQAPNEVSHIEIELAGNQVEVFSFYRENESKQIVDFWLNQDVVVQKPEEKIELKKPQRKITAVEKKVVNYPKKFLKPKIPDNKFRDFRYGAAFVWNYPPLISPPQKLVDTDNKTPDSFYPIKDLKIIDSEKLAHLQLSINLYRKSQFGLMNKSIDLYFKKYGEQADLDLNEFLKANAILKLNKGDQNKESSRFALKMLDTISKRTSNYALKSGILKYLVSIVLEQDDYVTTLREARKLFILAKQYSDMEVAGNLTNIILYSLAKLSQMDKLEEILKHPDYSKMIPEQLGLAYQSYILLSQDKTLELISLFEKSRKSLIDPIHESLLFNVAEAYFREAKYQNAVKYFTKFENFYSFHKYSSMAKMRVALSYDLMAHDPNEVVALYKNVIDNTSDFQVNYEARLRYVGLKCLRNKFPTQEDLESNSFLKLKSEDEKSLTENLKKTLWMVRLRSFIVGKDYVKALAYLEAIPLESLKPFEMLAFDGDGAEIAFGMIQDQFKKEDFPGLLKTYEVLNKKYEKKIGREPITKYLVGMAFLQVGAYDSFEKNYEDFKLLSESPKREFPIWIERDDSISPDNLMLDLAIAKNIKLENLDKAKTLLTELEEKFSDKSKTKYYNALINYKKGDYTKAIEAVEKFLSMDKTSEVVGQDEILKIFEIYSDSIYKIGDLQKYRKVTKALLEDVKSQSANFNPLRERILYVNLEIMAGEQKEENAIQLEKDSKLFMNEYPQSIYKERVTFLLGQSYIQMNKLDEGEKIMKDLVEGKSVPNYLKELARSELSFIKIKNKTI